MENRSMDTVHKATCKSLADRRCEVKYADLLVYMIDFWLIKSLIKTFCKEQHQDVTVTHAIISSYYLFRTLTLLDLTRFMSRFYLFCKM